jgi:hypothetical protein
MGRVTTKTGIANLSASTLKTNPVANIDPPDQKSKFAKAANRWYDDARRFALAQHIWNFAETETSVSKENSSELTGRFGNRFTLPADYIRIAWIGDEENPEKDYKIKKGFIYCNNASPLDFGYIYDNEDITMYSPIFVQYFAIVLAAFCSFEITGSRTMRAELLAEAEDFYSTATTVDGQESPPTHKIRRSRWKAAKEGRSLIGADYQGRVVT